MSQGDREGVGGLSPKAYVNPSTAIPSRTRALSPANTELWGLSTHWECPWDSHLPVNTHTPPAHPAGADSQSPALQAQEKEPFPAQRPSEWKSSPAGFKGCLQPCLKHRESPQLCS